MINNLSSKVFYKDSKGIYINRIPTKDLCFLYSIKTTTFSVEYYTPYTFWEFRYVTLALGSHIDFNPYQIVSNWDFNYDRNIITVYIGARGLNTIQINTASRKLNSFIYKIKEELPFKSYKHYNWFKIKINKAQLPRFIIFLEEVKVKENENR